MDPQDEVREVPDLFFSMISLFDENLFQNWDRFDKWVINQEVGIQIDHSSCSSFSKLD